MKLAVVTLTKGDHHRWYDAMERSVAAALPRGAQHVVLRCDSHDRIESMRWNALELAEYVCFVDDDDRVINNSIRLCMNALEANPDVAVAFTNERYIDAEGDALENPHAADRRPCYEHIAESAQTLHHLAMIRTSAIVPEARTVGERLGIGGEWLMKASAALRGGAIHIPIEGYEWRRHDAQHSKQDVWRQAYTSHMSMLSVYLAAQVVQYGPVQRLEIVSQGTA